MNTGTYGLTNSVRTQASGGETLLGLGSAQKRAGMQMLGSAAEQESKRNIMNEQNESARKQGNSQLGSAVGGAAAGAAFGPWGSLAGGIIGAIAGYQW